MAHSGKTMTFAADLLPHEDGIYNLGDADQKWNIFGDVNGTKITLGTASAAGSIVIYDGSNHYGTIKTTNLGSNRTYTLPNAAGTIALTSHNHDTVYSAIHQTSWNWAENGTEPLSKYVTFDANIAAGNAEKAPDAGWYNGFVSSHNNYLASFILNKHRTANWYVGYEQYPKTDITYTEPTWYLLAHSGNVGTGDNSGEIKIAGINVKVKDIGGAAYKAEDYYATKTEVNGLLAAADAMIFKGVINATNALPNSHNAGDTYRVGTAGTYPIVDSNGRYCEVGTLIICIADGTAVNAAHWTSVETNEDGAVISSSTSSTSNAIVRWDGESGRIIKNSTATLDNDGLLTTSAAKLNTFLYFTRSDGPSYIMLPADKGLIINNGNNNGTAYANLSINKTQVFNAYKASLGTKDYPWGSLYSGPLYIGNTDTAENTGYATANSGSNNYIAFYGVNGDNPGNYNHTYIGESIYGPKDSANEKSELLLFHGNDPGAGSGPDRIRLLAGQIEVQVYESALSGSWDTIRATTGIQVANFAKGKLTVNGDVTATTFTGNLTGNATNVTGIVAIANGGTGKNNASEAWTALGGGDSGKHANNYFVQARGNAGKSNMNDIGRLWPSSGMTNLKDPGNNNDNPMNGTTKSTGWHLYWDTSYQDDPNGSNAWVAQIVNKAGTSQWWVRSRSGSTITDGTAWTSNWRHLVTSTEAAIGDATTPAYVNDNGELQECTSYANASVNFATYSKYPQIVAGNEIRFDVSTRPENAIEMHIGYAWSDGSKKEVISGYRFDNGNGSNLTKVYASEFIGNVSRYYTSNSTIAPLQVRSNNKSVYIWQAGHATSESGDFSNNYALQYYGEGSSPNNYLILKASNSSTVTNAVQIDENGNITVAKTITGTITNATNATSAMKTERAGISSNWKAGRDVALLRMDEPESEWTTWTPAISIKTKDGSWDIGSYNTSAASNRLVFNYCADTVYTGTNAQGPTISFASDTNGSIIVADKFSGTLNGSATTLTNTRTIWGQNFNGSANVTGDLIDVGSQIKGKSGVTLISFLTSAGGALQAKLGRLGLNSSYANADLTNYVLDVGGISRFTGQMNITYAPTGTDSTGKGLLNLTSSAAATVVKSGTYSWGVNHLVTNLASGGNTCLMTGVGNGTNNQAVFEFHYHGSNNAENAVGLGLYGNNGLLTINKAGTVKIKATTASTSTTTGALVVGGGIATGAASYLTGSVHIVGSAGGDALVVRGISGCDSTGVRGENVDTTDQGLFLNINGGPVLFGYADATAGNYVHVQYNQDASSTGTGAFKVSGGVGISKKLYVGTSVNAPRFIATHIAGDSSEFKVQYSTTISYWWGVGTGNENHGLYDDKAGTGKWILSAAADNTWTFEGSVTGHASLDLPLTGGTLTGAVNFKNNTWNKVGDDVQIGDINKGGHLGIQGVNGNTGIFFTTYNQTTKTTGASLSWNGTDLIADKSVQVPDITIFHNANQNVTLQYNSTDDSLDFIFA